MRLNRCRNEVFGIEMLEIVCEVPTRGVPKDRALIADLVFLKIRTIMEQNLACYRAPSEDGKIFGDRKEWTSTKLE